MYMRLRLTVTGRPRLTIEIQLSWNGIVKYCRQLRVREITELSENAIDRIAEMIEFKALLAFEVKDANVSQYRLTGCQTSEMCGGNTPWNLPHRNSPSWYESRFETENVKWTLTEFYGCRSRILKCRKHQTDTQFHKHSLADWWCPFRFHVHSNRIWRDGTLIVWALTTAYTTNRDTEGVDWRLTGNALYSGNTELPLRKSQTKNDAIFLPS